MTKRTSPSQRALGDSRYKWALTCPWKRACLQFMGPKGRLQHVYDAMHWSPGVVFARGQRPDLRATEIIAMAKAVRAPIHKFFEVYTTHLIKAGAVHKKPRAQAENLPQHKHRKKSS